MASRVDQRHQAPEAELSVDDVVRSFVGLGSLLVAAAEFRKREFVLEGDEGGPLSSEVLVVAVVRLRWPVVRMRRRLGLVLGPLGEGDANGRIRPRRVERREDGDRNGA